MEKNKKTQNKNIHGKPEISSGHDITMSSSKWLGAFIFYLVNLGKIPIKELWIKKYSRRNLWVGYFFKLLLLMLVLWLTWEFYLEDSLEL